MTLFNNKNVNCSQPPPVAPCAPRAPRAPKSRLVPHSPQTAPPSHLAPCRPRGHCRYRHDQPQRSARCRRRGHGQFRLRHADPVLNARVAFLPPGKRHLVRHRRVPDHHSPRRRQSALPHRLSPAVLQFRGLVERAGPNDDILGVHRSWSFHAPPHPAWRRLGNRFWRDLCDPGRRHDHHLLCVGYHRDGFVSPDGQFLGGSSSLLGTLCRTDVGMTLTGGVMGSGTLRNMLKIPAARTTNLAFELS